MHCGDSVPPSREDRFPLGLRTGFLHGCPAALRISISWMNTNHHRIFVLVYHMTPHPIVLRTAHFETLSLVLLGWTPHESSLLTAKRCHPNSGCFPTGHTGLCLHLSIAFSGTALSDVFMSLSTRAGWWHFKKIRWSSSPPGSHTTSAHPRSRRWVILHRSQARDLSLLGKTRWGRGLVFWVFQRIVELL